MQGKIAILMMVLAMCLPGQVWAAPYFTLDGATGMYPGGSFEFRLKLETDSESLTSAQTVISYDSSLLNKVSIDATSTVCSFWAPADPALGYGNSATPYFYQNQEVVVACGFSNPGYTTSTLGGDVVVTFRLTPTTTATQSGTSKQTTLSLSETQLYYAGTSITPGASGSHTVTIFPTALQATPTPTPTSAPSAETLTDNDLNFIEIGTTNTTTGTTTTQSTLDDGTLTSLSRDDSIPPPPDDLARRLPVAPFQTAPTTNPETGEKGNVLSIRSLREILIPGKSEADQTVVLINLLSTLAFLTILAMLIWRLITLSRKNKFKYHQMKDLLTGELSVLEGKLGDTEILDQKDQLERLKQELEQV
jgi:hypothetical protein